MLTAIILCRSKSSRFPNKHFSKIGKKNILEIIIDKLIKNKRINEIYLATGNKNNNFLYEKKLSKITRYKNLKYYYSKDEDNVTERINNVCKLIDNDYSLIISGDCCLIDNSLINRIYNSLKKNLKYDFIKCNKQLVHEGLKIFKTKAWDKVNFFSKKTIYQEHPGYFLNVTPNLFNITNFIPKKFEIGKNIRLSIDTQSDLDFLNLLFRIVNQKYEKFTIQNILKKNYLQFKIVNSHVEQKQVNKIYNKKINFITSVEKKYGLGHFMRCKTLYREINETFSSNLNFFFIKKDSHKIDLKGIRNYKLLNKLNSKLFSNDEIFIVDLPYEMLKKISTILNKFKKKVILIDNFSPQNKNNVYLPIIKFYNNKNINLIKTNNLILKRDLLFEKLKKNKKIYDQLFITSGSFFFNQNVLDFIKIHPKLKTLCILGPYCDHKEINQLKKLKIPYLVNPKNISELMCSSKKIFTRFGVTAFEIMSIGLKPIIILHNETPQRLKDIKNLENNNLIILFNKFIKNNKTNMALKKCVKLNFGAPNFIKFLKNI
jgi:spore coat polysaccharide biosynthesis protein SpsF (cytidylyltransferase family)